MCNFWRPLATGGCALLWYAFTTAVTRAQTPAAANARPRILLVLDMEGVSCVNDPRMVEPDPRFAALYAKGVDCLVDDVNAVVDGFGQRARNAAYPSSAVTNWRTPIPRRDDVPPIEREIAASHGLRNVSRLLGCDLL